MNRTRSKYSKPKAPLWEELLSQSPPAFTTRHISEPSLVFAGGQRSVDPKTGLELFGPAGLNAAPRQGIRVGLIGTGDTISLVKRLVEQAKNRIVAGLDSKGKPYNSLIAAAFPGFSLESPFQAELVFPDPCTATFTQNQLDAALRPLARAERVQNMVNLVVGQLRVFADKEPQPDVVVVAMPKAVEEACGQAEKRGSAKKQRLSQALKKYRRMLESAKNAGQGFLYDMEPDDCEDDSQPLTRYQNFHDSLKAHGMQCRLPTQLVWESTLNGTRGLQDPASIAWNFFTALYYKAGNMPWELRFPTPRTCFVGVSFYRDGSDPNSPTRTSLAQAFSETGEGLVLRGECITWDKERDRRPHLNRESAERLLRDVIALYTQHFGGPPKRVVVHKTSRYWEDELAGFRAGLGDITQYDFLALERRGIRFFRLGQEPIVRGTMIELGRRNYLVYTGGYIPFLRCYPGPRIPNPLEVVEHHGESASEVVCSEILALSKLNWNTCAFASANPVTLAFARNVATILKELPNGVVPETKYKFYM